MREKNLARLFLKATNGYTAVRARKIQEYRRACKGISDQDCDRLITIQAFLSYSMSIPESEDARRVLLCQQLVRCYANWSGGKERYEDSPTGDPLREPAKHFTLDTPGEQAMVLARKTQTGLRMALDSASDAFTGCQYRGASATDALGFVGASLRGKLDFVRSGVVSQGTHKYSDVVMYDADVWIAQDLQKQLDQLFALSNFRPEDDPKGRMIRIHNLIDNQLVGRSPGNRPPPPGTLDAYRVGDRYYSTNGGRVFSEEEAVVMRAEIHERLARKQKFDCQDVRLRGKHSLDIVSSGGLATAQQGAVSGASASSEAAQPQTSAVAATSAVPPVTTAVNTSVMTTATTTIAATASTSSSQTDTRPLQGTPAPTGIPSQQVQSSDSGTPLASAAQSSDVQVAVLLPTVQPPPPPQTAQATGFPPGITQDTRILGVQVTPSGITAPTSSANTSSGDSSVPDLLDTLSQSSEDVVYGLGETESRQFDEQEQAQSGTASGHQDQTPLHQQSYQTNEDWGDTDPPPERSEAAEGNLDGPPRSDPAAPPAGAVRGHSLNRPSGRQQSYSRSYNYDRRQSSGYSDYRQQQPPGRSYYDQPSSTRSSDYDRLVGQSSGRSSNIRARPRGSSHSGFVYSGRSWYKPEPEYRHGSDDRSREERRDYDRYQSDERNRPRDTDRRQSSEGYRSSEEQPRKSSKSNKASQAQKDKKVLKQQERADNRSTWNYSRELPMIREAERNSADQDEPVPHVEIDKWLTWNRVDQDKGPLPDWYREFSFIVDDRGADETDDQVAIDNTRRFLSWMDWQRAVYSAVGPSNFKFTGPDLFLRSGSRIQGFQPKWASTPDSPTFDDKKRVLRAAWGLQGMLMTREKAGDQYAAQALNAFLLHLGAWNRNLRFHARDLLGPRESCFNKPSRGPIEFALHYNAATAVCNEHHLAWTRVDGDPSLIVGTAAQVLHKLTTTEDPEDTPPAPVSRVVTPVPGDVPSDGDHTIVRSRIDHTPQCSPAGQPKLKRVCAQPSPETIIETPTASEVQTTSEVQSTSQTLDVEVTGTDRKVTLKDVPTLESISSTPEQTGYESDTSQGEEPGGIEEMSDRVLDVSLEDQDWWETLDVVGKVSTTAADFGEQMQTDHTETTELDTEDITDVPQDTTETDISDLEPDAQVDVRTDTLIVEADTSERSDSRRVAFSDRIEVSEEPQPMDDTLEDEDTIADENAQPADYGNYRNSTPISWLSEEDSSGRSGASTPLYPPGEEPTSPRAGIDRSESPSRVLPAGTLGEDTLQLLTEDLDTLTAD